jgi:hypothetical protein
VSSTGKSDGNNTRRKGQEGGEGLPQQEGLLGRVGIPDFICCYRGTFIAIETKAPGKMHTVTPNQQRVIDEIQRHGGLAVVADSVDSLTPIFDILEENL